LTKKLKIDRFEGRHWPVAQLPYNLPGRI
jgi:hypothetical protein